VAAHAAFARWSAAMAPPLTLSVATKLTKLLLCQIRVDYDGRDAAAFGVFHGAAHGHVVDRGQDDAVDAAHYHALHDVDLGRAIVAPDRSLPDYV
jgi:hypothetical protein